MTSKYGFFAEQEYIPPIAHQAIKRGVRKEAKENALRPFRLVSKDHSGKVMRICPGISTISQS